MFRCRVHDGVDGVVANVSYVFLFVTGVVDIVDVKGGYDLFVCWLCEDDDDDDDGCEKGVFPLFPCLMIISVKKGGVCLACDCDVFLCYCASFLLQLIVEQSRNTHTVTSTHGHPPVFICKMYHHIHMVLYPSHRCPQS